MVLSSASMKELNIKAMASDLRAHPLRYSGAMVASFGLVSLVVSNTLGSAVLSVSELALAILVIM